MATNKRDKRLAGKAKKFLNKAESFLEGSDVIFSDTWAPSEAGTLDYGVIGQGRNFLDKAGLLLGQLQKSKKTKSLDKRIRSLAEQYQVGSPIEYGFAPGYGGPEDPGQIYSIAASRIGGFQQPRYGGGFTRRSLLTRNEPINTSGMGQSISPASAPLTPRPTLDTDPLVNVGAMLNF